nr:MAG TPA: hypothetical protein [Caudoviricetes sp.]
MNIKEVIEKCNNGDCVVDSNNRKWTVIKGFNIADLTSGFSFISDLYRLNELFDLDFKKVYDVDWTKVEVDTKILVSEDGDVWYKKYFAKYENDKVYTFIGGATSFSSGGYFISWKYAKLYKEDGEEEKNGN